MTATIKPHNGWRWQIELAGPDTFGEDIGPVGVWVGPRTGPDKRTQDQMEEYILRRLLVAWKVSGCLSFPVVVHAERGRDAEPDFVLSWPNGKTVGIEVTEASEENYQAWLTKEAHSPSGEGVPHNLSTDRTLKELARAITAKNRKYDRGWYQAPDACDLVVYDNTASGGFLDKSGLIESLTKKNDLRGQFRQVHIVFEAFVFLDVFGEQKRVDVRKEHEIDFAAWTAEQAENLRAHTTDRIDWVNVAEEMENLGRSERRALGSHLRVLIAHLLKWNYQPERQGSSWRFSIENARSEIQELLTEMPSLRSYLSTETERQYARAKRLAVAETELHRDAMPENCPYSLEQLVDPGFYPGNDISEE